jgi:hypothetical protein
MRDLRRTTGGDHQANRKQPILSAQMTGEFKAHQCSEAVAEKGKRLVQERKEGVGKGLDER